MNKQQLERIGHLNDLIKLLRLELNELQDIENKELKSAYIGRYYKAVNNYSCPKEEADYWNEYYHVTESTTTSPFLDVINFSVDSLGKIKLQRQDVSWTTVEYWQEITKEEYLDAFYSMIKDIQFIYDGIKQ